MLRIAPSILSADFSRLGSEIREAELGGADWLHIDVMDGRFVPNITVGIPVVKSIRKVTDMFLDVHLMITEPVNYAARFCDAGADLVSFHVEADSPEGIDAAVEAVKEKDKKVGIVLKPATPADAAAPWLERVDMVLVMTVEPGFGGQSFMADMLPKIRELRAMMDRVNPGCILETDGGIDVTTAPLVSAAGCDMAVAGSAVFGKTDRSAAIRAIRESAQTEKE